MKRYAYCGALRAAAFLALGAMAALSNAQLYNFNNALKDYEGNQDNPAGKSTLVAPDGAVYVAATALSDRTPTLPTPISEIIPISLRTGEMCCTTK